MSVDKRVIDTLNSIPAFEPVEYSNGGGIYITIHSDGEHLYWHRRGTPAHIITKRASTGEWYSTEFSESTKSGFITRTISHSEMKVMELWLKDYLASNGIEYTDAMAGSAAHNWWPYPPKPTCVVHVDVPVEKQDWFQQMKKLRELADAAAQEMLEG